MSLVKLFICQKLNRLTHDLSLLSLRAGLCKRWSLHGAEEDVDKKKFTVKHDFIMSNLLFPSLTRTLDSHKQNKSYVKRGGEDVEIKTLIVRSFVFRYFVCIKLNSLFNSILITNNNKC